MTYITNNHLTDLISKYKDLAIKNQSEFIDLFFDDFFEFAYARIIDVGIFGDKTVVKVGFKEDSETDEITINTLAYLMWASSFDE